MKIQNAKELLSKIETDLKAAELTKKGFVKHCDDLGEKKELIKNLIYFLSEISAEKKYDFIDSFAKFSGILRKNVSDTVSGNDLKQEYHTVLKLVDLVDVDSSCALGDKFNTYALAMDALRNRGLDELIMPLFVKDDGSIVFRPYSMPELQLAKLEDFFTYIDADGNERSIEDRLRFWKSYSHSCTGIIGDGKGNFKIDSISKDLILIDKDFNSSVLLVNYDSINQPSFKYDKKFFERGLKTSEAADFEPFRLLFGDDDIGKSIISESNDVITKNNLDKNGMGLYVPEDLEGLRALYSDYGSNVNSYYLLNNARFLLSSPREKLHEK